MHLPWPPTPPPASSLGLRPSVLPVHFFPLLEEPGSFILLSFKWVVLVGPAPWLGLCEVTQRAKQNTVECLQGAWHWLSVSDFILGYTI